MTDQCLSSCLIYWTLCNHSIHSSDFHLGLDIYYRTSTQPLIGPTISKFTTSSDLWILDVLCWLYLDNWSGFEAAKTPPWLSRGLHHRGKFLELSDEWAGRGCYCFLMRCHSWALLADQEWCRWIIELKFEFFSFNTFDVSQIFWQRAILKQFLSNSWNRSQQVMVSGSRSKLVNLLPGIPQNSVLDKLLLLLDTLLFLLDTLLFLL